MPRDHNLTSYSRVWLVDGRSRPYNTPTYEGLMRAGAISWSQGDITLIRRPDPDKYGKFQTIGKISGEEGNPELTLTARYTDDMSKLLKLARKRCDFDVHIHFGQCEDPRDFNGGFSKALILSAARVSTYGTTDLGALESSENAVVNEEVPVAGEDLLEIVPISYGLQASVLVSREVIDVTVCDTEACGECGETSDGCNKVFAVVSSSTGSPGILTELVYTYDGGQNWFDMTISTFAGVEVPSAVRCVGNFVVVVSNTSQSLHYIAISEALAGIPSWNEVSTGFVGAGAPNAIHSISSSHTWIVGNGGYVYFTSDPTGGVTVQSAGSATTQNLNAIHALDEIRAVAVGNNNAVIYTADGTAWNSVVGPAPGANLNTVWMHGEGEWLVGTSTGRLFYTKDFGRIWTEKGFPGAGNGAVRDIKFHNDAVGYMATSIVTPAPAGRILRTINGGNSWYVTPERRGNVIPANIRINRVATCADPNVVYGAGLGPDSTDGILIKGRGG